ncbi:hypothetical protein BLL42_00855 [Pseudomonas frederiksbergensis]|uniref:beta-lactamase n=1 Tax=Pseudomonas frederiksbergensis TaxID=104087 RepID=A0A1J0EEY0_9PSED|nr:serine hydrolase [Pseudomonas frederiksbergensis]APC14356.1 hypothetical protein BLL42_00855 [Pseudomonas frederiksbergensis]
MWTDYEVLRVMGDGGYPSLQAIGQRMIEWAKREQACSYRWYVRDVVCGTHHDFKCRARSPSSSTRKLYILVTVLLLIERGEFALSDSILVDKERAGHQTCGGLWLLDSPRAFTVAELLKLMMGLSDNIATFYLVEMVGLDRLNALSSVLGLSGTWHLSAVPSQALAVDHALNAVNTTTALDLVTALSILVNGTKNRLPHDGHFISKALCEFGLHIMRGQQDTTAIRGWLTDIEQVGDKHGIGYRNYNNVGYLARGGEVKIVFSIIVDDLHRIEEPRPAFAYARDFIALFSRLLDDYSRLEH